MTTPLTLSRILYRLRRSSLSVDSSSPSAFCATRLVRRALSVFGSAACRLLAVLEPAELHPLRLFLALADDDHVDFLADRRVGDDARQVAQLLDVLAVELDDDVAGLDAGGLRRALVVDAGDQRAARRLDVEAFGDVVGDLLDAHAEPAAAQSRRTGAAGRSPPPTVFDGTAKPMPIEPPDGEMIAVLTPMTSPSRLNSGPPELPRLMAASVWM